MANIPKISNNYILFGAIAAAALVMPAAALGPLLFDEAAAEHRRIVGGDQSNRAAEQGNALVNAQVGVNANVQQGQICVQAITSESQQCD